IVLCHGIVAAVFAFVFLLEAFEIALPLISLEAQHPNFIATEYSKAACLFVAVGIGTFAAYEIFFFPSYLNSADDISKKKIKMIFVSYHIPWSLMITYIALLDGAAWNAWISVVVMYGFTLWGTIAKS
ncbi:MAG: hypothetical protein H8E55_74475, partial [Pelagibacterales bacterium]|nr:hypothetical protein [Pelagibacterales bacterium]